MKTKTTIGICIVLLLIVAGCSGGSPLSFRSTGDTRSTQPSDADVQVGTQGLVMDFSRNAPPDQIYEDTLFPVGVTLQNRGAADILDGFVSFGLETAYARISSQRDPLTFFELEGRSGVNPAGGEEFITITAKSQPIGAQSETHPTTVFVTACYQYETKLSTDICIDTDIFGLSNREKACRAEDLNFGSGQGAPVAITRIETRMLPFDDESFDPDSDNRRLVPHFMIHVENKGNGEVILKDIDTIERACTSEPLAFDDFNRIEIEAKLSTETLDCKIRDRDSSGAATLRLRDKKDVIRCTLKDGRSLPAGQDPFLTPLVINLNYGYTFTISKGIIIEKVLTY